MRLNAVKIVSALPEALNTLTQRIFDYYSDSYSCSGVTKLDVSNLKDGDVAGLAIFQKHYAFIGVKQEEGKKYLVMVNDGKTVESVAVEKNVVYLRATASDKTQNTFFEYSFNKEEFNSIGNKLEMKFNLDVFTGDKFCLFIFPTKQLGGFADFDWFRAEPYKKQGQICILSMLCF